MRSEVSGRATMSDKLGEDVEAMSSLVANIGIRIGIGIGIGIGLILLCLLLLLLYQGHGWFVRRIDAVVSVRTELQWQRPKRRHMPSTTVSSPVTRIGQLALLQLYPPPKQPNPAI